jgi:hypothetical protein
MQKFDAQIERVRKDEQAQLNKPDEDGFVTVVNRKRGVRASGSPGSGSVRMRAAPRSQRKGPTTSADGASNRPAPVPIRVVRPNAIAKTSTNKNKKKQGVNADFYKFQVKEAKLDSKSGARRERRKRRKRIKRRIKK